MDDPAQFGALLSLLDDQDEEVQKALKKALSSYQGDASDDLAALGVPLRGQKVQLLSDSLHAGRQKLLREQWAIPAHALRSPDGDFEHLESLLRLISDFLHDGVTLRPSLSDELDLLTQEADSLVSTPLDLAKWLFTTGKFTGNKEAPFDYRNSDLAWCLEQKKSNPIGLSLIYLLVAQRLGLSVYGVNYPGHFLCIIETQEGNTLIDCYHKGRPILVSQLLKDHPELSKQAVAAVREPCSLGAILRRILTNLNLAFEKADRPQDAAITVELMATITP